MVGAQPRRAQRSGGHLIVPAVTWQLAQARTLVDAQHVLMSATLGDTTRYEEDLEARTGRPVAVVRSVGFFLAFKILGREA